MDTEATGTEALDLELVRRSFEGALGDAPGAGALDLLAKLGWEELLAADPAVAVGELFEAQGRLLATTPVLDLVVAKALGAALEPDTAVVHPGLHAPPGGAPAGPGAVIAEGVVLAGGERASRLVVPVPDPEGATRLVEIPAAGAMIEPARGMDETLGLTLVRAEVPAGAAFLAQAPWPVAVAAARRALTHELIGVAQEMLDVACRQVTDRIQFGKPIAAFQSVRHRLTEVHVAIAAARPVLEAAWVTGDPLAASAAKALAGQAGTVASKHCLQVTGAIGFTWEHGLHRRIRRLSVLDALYGSASALQGSIGAALAASRTVPRIRPLP